MKKISYIFFLLFAIYQNGYAVTACFTFQTTSGYSNKGCSPLAVKAIDCSGGSSIQYDWGDGVPNPNPYSPTHIYSDTGTFIVKQIVNNGGSSSTTTGIVHVLPLTPPNFNITICAGLGVGVKILDNVYDKYVINWGDGSLNDTINGNSSINHVTTSGNKNIGVTGIYLSSSACSKTTTTTVTPVVTLVKPDIIKLEVDNQASGNGQITVTLSPRIGQKYYIDQSIGNTSSYSAIDSFPIFTNNNIITKSIANLNTDINQYCYRFRSFDDCGNTNTSEQICSNIINVTAVSDQDQVVWTPFMGTAGSFSQNSLYGTSTGTVSPATSPYLDVNVICNNTYTYFVVTELSTLTSLGTPIISISDKMPVTAISTTVPPAVQNLNSTVNGNLINLTWDVPVFTPAASQYTVLRSTDGVNFTAYATTNTNSFTDNSVNVNSDQYCYKVIYTPCTVTSPPGSSTCSVLFTGNETGGINLTWSNYTCPNGSAPDYTVERLDPNTNAVVSSVNPATSPFQDTQADPNAPVLKYRVKTVCTGSNPIYSNIFEINHELKLFLPTAFTPDGDGNNDIFLAKGNYIKDFKMTIYNRWGEIVFFSDLFTYGWDGKYKGENASMDAYAYMVEATDNFGNKLTKKGTVTLLR